MQCVGLKIEIIYYNYRKYYIILILHLAHVEFFQTNSCDTRFYNYA